MSKLARRLKNISDTATPAVGFRAGMTAVKHQGPVLIAIVARDIKSARVAVDSGADAVLVEACPEKDLTDIAGAVPTAPCGIIQNDKTTDLGAMKFTGIDFLVFSPANAPASWLKLDGPAKIAKVPANVEPHALRGIERVGVDGVLLDRSEDIEFVSVEFLMNCHYLKGALSKPLLAALPSGASAEDVVDLWDAGIDGFVIDAGPEVLRSISKTILGLAPRAKRKDNKTTPLVPRISTSSAEEDEEEGG